MSMQSVESDAYVATYVIYDRPSDYPINVVVRRWVARAGLVQPDPEPMAIVETVEAARRTLRPLGLVCIGRQAEDDPKIAEVWV